MRFCGSIILRVKKEDFEKEEFLKIEGNSEILLF